MSIEDTYLHRRMLPACSAWLSKRYVVADQLQLPRSKSNAQPLSSCPELTSLKEAAFLMKTVFSPSNLKG